MLWSDVQKLRPSNLKISPLAVVPQKDRRGRLILDLSFPVYLERTRANSQPQPLQPGVNNTTITRIAPDALVREIGNVFRRVLSLLNGLEADEVVMLSKIDLSDRFWRMLVQKPAYEILPTSCRIRQDTRFALLSHRPSKWAGQRVHPTSVPQPEQVAMSSKALSPTKSSSPPIASNNTCTQLNPPSAASPIVPLTGSTSMLTTLLARRSKTKAAPFLAASPERHSTASIPSSHQHLSQATQATQVARIPYLSRSSSVAMRNTGFPSRRRNQNGPHLQLQSQGHCL
jgi:hypothetical protein